jgi:hypothetical protein
MGEGLPVTVSGGPTLRCDIIITLHPVLVVPVNLVLDQYTRSLQLQYRKMRSFHPDQGPVVNGLPSILYLLPLSRCIDTGH